MQQQMKKEVVFKVVEKMNITKDSLPTAAICVQELHLPRYVGFREAFHVGNQGNIAGKITSSDYGSVHVIILAFSCLKQTHTRIATIQQMEQWWSTHLLKQIKDWNTTCDD